MTTNLMLYFILLTRIGLTIDYWPDGFEQGPGGPEYNDRQALAYHIYCLDITNPALEGLCNVIDTEFFTMRKK